jgi:hypothetical protein
MTELIPTNQRRTRFSRVLILSIVACFGTVGFAPAAFADHKPNHQAPKLVNARHHLKMYKVEKVFDVEGDALVREMESISCDTNGPGAADNDIATDGMWKVVDVDQDEFGSRPLTDVRVYAAYNDPANSAKYNFEFENLNEERAQLKLYVTCLKRTVVQNNGHDHEWFTSLIINENQSGVNPGPGNGRYKAVTGPVVGPNAQFPVANSGEVCDVGEIAISPGFHWHTGYGDIYQSIYRNASPGNWRDWIWGFWVRPGAFNVEVSHRCLRIKTLPGGAKLHAHNLVFDFEPSYLPPFTLIGPDPDGAGPGQNIETRVRNCDAHEKGMVHSFDLDPQELGQHLWFLGMDPRIKSRAYKVENKDVVARNAQFGLMCFEDRTNKNIKP